MQFWFCFPHQPFPRHQEPAQSHYTQVMLAKLYIQHVICRMNYQFYVHIWIKQITYSMLIPVLERCC